jgi:hypothetical protein
VATRPILLVALQLAGAGFSAEDERPVRPVDFAAGTLLFRTGAIPCFGVQNNNDKTAFNCLNPAQKKDVRPAPHALF